MKINEDIRPITYLKSRAADLLRQIHETQRPVIITQNGAPCAVLQDAGSYEQMRRAIGLLKLAAQGEEDIRAGHTIPQTAVFANLRSRLKTRRSSDAHARTLPR